MLSDMNTPAYLVMALGDTDTPERKYHPVNLLDVTKQMRQTGKGFSSAWHAISITIQYHAQAVKSPACV